MTPEILKAFREVRSKVSDQIDTLIIFSDGSWAYMIGKTKAFPPFGEDVDELILEEACDSLNVLPAIFQYNEKTYDIPIIFQSVKTFKVGASSLQEAVTVALRSFFAEKDDYYIEDSFEVDEIVEDRYPTETFDLDKAINEA
jgi:hypothetical protein